MLLVALGVMVWGYVLVCIYRGRFFWEMGICRRSDMPVRFWLGVGLYSGAAGWVIYAGLQSWFL